MVREHKICLNKLKGSTKETIQLQKVPERPCPQVASDIFHVNGTDYIVIANAYSGFFDFVGT